MWSVLILNEGLKAGFENRSTTKCANSILVLNNNKNIYTHFIQFGILSKTKPSNTIAQELYLSYLTDRLNQKGTNL